MIPHRFSPLLCLLTLCSSQAFAQTPEADAIRNDWKMQRDAALAGKSLDAGKVAASAEAMRSLLFRENPNPLGSVAAELMGYTTAQAWVKQGNYEKAGDAFSAELLAQQSAANPMLHNTRDPSGFAQEVFVLHSEIAAHTEQEIANSDYLIFPVGGGTNPSFVFVYGTEDPNEKGVKLAGVDPSLQRRIVYLTAPGPQGSYRIADRVEILGDRATFTAQLKFDEGKPFLVLDGVRRLIQPNPAGIPQVFDCPSPKLRLKIDAARLEQPAAALARNGQKPGALCVLPAPPPPIAGLDAPALASGPVEVAASIVTTAWKNPVKAVLASGPGSGAAALSISAPKAPAPALKPAMAATGVVVDSKPSVSPGASPVPDQPAHVASGLDIGSPTIKKAGSDHEEHGPSSSLQSFR